MVKTNNATEFSINVVGRALVNDNGKYLLIKRNSEEPYGDSWEIPGGRLKTLEDIKTSITRETFEETGLIIEVVSNRVYVGTTIAQEGSRVGSTYLNLIYPDTKLIAGKIKLDKEHKEYGWFSVKEIFKLDLASYIKLPLTELLLARD